MTNPMMAVRELLNKHGIDEPDDVLRQLLTGLLQGLMEEEVSAQIGAGLYERNLGRTGYRNGYRKRSWNTRMGSIDLRIPRLRSDSYFPEFLDRYQRHEQALMAVVYEAYVNGVSTRKVKRLVNELGVERLTRSAVSRICGQLDELVEELRSRPIEERIVYLYLDAKVLKVRENGRVVNSSLLVAVGVTDDARRRVLGLDVVTSESEPGWQALLRSLRDRGMRGVQLVISDAHKGLRHAIESELSGASWQRCRFHFQQNVLSHVRKRDSDEVRDLLRSIFAQPTADDARAQLHRVVDGTKPRYPKVARMLEEAEDQILAYSAFPRTHWRRLWTNNCAERLIREVARRTDVVGIFPYRASQLRLVGALLIEQDEEWLTGRRYMSAKSMAQVRIAVLDPPGIGNSSKTNLDPEEVTAAD